MNSAPNEDNLEPDVAESLEAVAEARQRLAEVPAEMVISNHAMGLYELAAIHLTSSPPGLQERLGENFEVLKDALANIRLAFVQVKNSL
jgi:hypothetical protein